MSAGKVAFNAPDGRRYAARVQVNSIQGRFLFRVSPAQAHRMVLDGAFTVDADGKRAYLLILQRTPPCDPQPFTRVRGLRDFSGTRYVYRELVGHGADGQNLYAFQFRNISVWDQWAFCLAQSENLVSGGSDGN